MSNPLGKYIGASGVARFIELACTAAGSLLTLAHGADSAGNSLPLLTDSLGRQITAQTAPIEQRNIVGALAASGVYYGAPIDLGAAATRQHTLIMAYASGATSTGTIFYFLWSDDGVVWKVHLPNAAGSSGQAAAPAGAIIHAQARPMGRFMKVAYMNGSAAQTVLEVHVTCLAGI